MQQPLVQMDEWPDRQTDGQKDATSYYLPAMWLIKSHEP